MDLCSRNPNRTVPVSDGVPRRADVPLCSRTNGWSWPPHPFQLLAWLLYLYFAVTGFGVFIPLLPSHWIPAGYIVSFVMKGKYRGGNLISDSTYRPRLHTELRSDLSPRIDVQHDRNDDSYVLNNSQEKLRIILFHLCIASYFICPRFTHFLQLFSFNPVFSARELHLFVTFLCTWRPSPSTLQTITSEQRATKAHCLCSTARNTHTSSRTATVTSVRWTCKYG